MNHRVVNTGLSLKCRILTMNRTSSGTEEGKTATVESNSAFLDQFIEEFSRLNQEVQELGGNPPVSQQSEAPRISGQQKSPSGGRPDVTGGRVRVMVSVPSAPGFPAVKHPKEHLPIFRGRVD